MLPLLATLVSVTEKTSALGTLIHLLRGRPGFDPWVGKIPLRRGQLPTPVFWPGEFHGLYSPWGRKESDTTERLSLSLSLSVYKQLILIYLIVNPTILTNTSL